MSDAGILYLRLSHMADYRSAGHPPAPATSMALEADLSVPKEIPEAPKTPPERLRVNSGDFVRLEASRFPPLTIRSILATTT